MARRRPTELKAEEGRAEGAALGEESSMVACSRTKRYRTQLAGISGAPDLGPAGRVGAEFVRAAVAVDNADGGVDQLAHEVSCYLLGIARCVVHQFFAGDERVTESRLQ